MAPAKVLASRNTVAEVGHNAITQPGPAHLKRAVKRFGERLGNQFGAAITYFLVLAVMPIAMFTFASLGFVLDVLKPELLPVVVEQIEAQVGGNSSLTEQLESFLTSWQSVGIIAILAALYTGQDSSATSVLLCELNSTRTSTMSSKTSRSSRRSSTTS